METIVDLITEKLQHYLKTAIAALPMVAMAIIVSIIFWLLAATARKHLGNKLKSRIQDNLLADFVAKTTRFTIIIIGVLIVLAILGLEGPAASLLAGAGITAFIIGFALKDIGENFIAGILMAFKRPFQVGDLIESNGHRGRVISLNLRDTQIKSADGRDIYLPNGSILKNPLINFDIDGYLRHEFVIGLDYGSDYRKAIEVIEEAMSGVAGVLQDHKKPSIHFSELASSTLNITVKFWEDTYNAEATAAKIKSDAILTVLEAMEKANFNMPCTILELKNYRDLPLKNVNKTESN